jgi:hypothetical protein
MVANAAAGGLRGKTYAGSIVHLPRISGNHHEVKSRESKAQPCDQNRPVETSLLTGETLPQPGSVCRGPQPLQNNHRKCNESGVCGSGRELPG